MELTQFIAEVESGLGAVIAGATGALGIEPGAAPLAGGKRLRPRLVFESARVLGTDMAKACRYAVTVELVHLASLCHDDVIDRAAIRRGAPSLNALQGNQNAVLMGDYLYASASLMVSTELGLGIAKILSETFLKMTESELRQARLMWNPAADQDLYFRIIEGKTAALFEACAAGPASIAGASGEVAAAFGAFGRGFGMAFQIVDDVLDYTPRSSSWGKEPLKDFKEGLVTLPLILALGNGNGAGKAAVVKHLASRGSEPFDPAAVGELIRLSGATDRCAAIADRYVSDGLAAVEHLAPSAGLRAFARESLGRTF